MPTGQFSCNACQKTYAWKPQLAGKRVKCKCGSPISVPAEDPALADAPPAEFEDLYALAQGDAADEPVAPPPIARAAPALAVAGVGAGAVAPVAPARPGRGVKSGGGTPPRTSAAAAGRPNLLGYAQMGGGRRRVGLDDEKSGEIFFSPLKDLYIPGGLVLLGAILLYFVMTYHRGIASPGVALLAVGTLCFINLCLTIPGVLMTVRMFDLGLGPIGPGMMKIAACAIAPGAIGELIAMFFTGSFAGYIGWFLSLCITFTIFMKLLDMDFFETAVCSSIIWVIQTWVGYAIMFALLNGIGISGLPAGAFGGPGGGGGGRANLAGEIHVDEDEALDGIRAKEMDEVTLQMLVSPGGVDGKEWIEAVPNRTLARQSREKSLELMRAFYAAGAKEVRVWPRKDAKGNESASLLVVCPHEEKGARNRVVDQLKKLAKDLRRVGFRDRGEKYFLVRMVTAEEELELARTQGQTTPVGGGIKLKKGAAGGDPDIDVGGDDDE